MVYDNYNALAIGFGPNDKAGRAILSLAVMPHGSPYAFSGEPACPIRTAC